MIAHQHLKRLLALCATVLLIAGISACGSTDKSDSQAAKTTETTSSSPAETVSTPPASPDKSDNDGDSNGQGPHDSDDQSVLHFGHPAPASTKTSIEALVRRYYAAAAAEEGARACSMLYSLYAEAIPEDYGISPPGPAYARGTTCPAVLTATFKHFHTGLATRLPKLTVSAVRIKQHQAVAILSFGAMPEREIRLSREGHNWKVLALVDNELP